MPYVRRLFIIVLAEAAAGRSSRRAGRVNCSVASGRSAVAACALRERICIMSVRGCRLLCGRQDEHDTCAVQQCAAILTLGGIPAFCIHAWVHVPR